MIVNLDNERKSRSSITEWFIYIPENALLILPTDNERVLFCLYIMILRKRTPIN